MVVTANEGLRGGKRIPLKKTVDRAVEGMSMVETVLVARRTEHEVPMTPGRDLWLDEECRKQRSTCTNEWMGAEDPLFILYTSGSTGKPKGLMHTTGGYLVYAAYTHKMVFDYHPGDVFFCAADVGWITGHSYIVYGPLANGATTVMFESTPTYPDAGRYWRIVDDLGVNIFYTAPTALRALAQGGDDWVKRYRRDSLRVLGSVGEPINPEIWRWYHDVVGDSRCAVVDTWWQTETGGILITPLPGVTPTKPGSATLPFFGVKPVVLDTADGKVLEGNGVSGALCLATPWPGQARTVWGDHHRFKETYFTQFPGYYFTGDGVRRDEDGYYWITGRIDDVLNVSGHRLGTAEIESALVAHESVAEAAVVGFPHPIKGQGIYAYVLVNSDYASADRDQLQGALKEQVRHMIGAFAAPDVIHIASGLPKTRSGKIMRRILRKIAGVRVRGARGPQHPGRAGGRGPAHRGAQDRPQVRLVEGADRAVERPGQEVRLALLVAREVVEERAHVVGPRRPATGLGARRAQRVESADEPLVLAAEAGADGRLIGGEFLDLLEQPRPLLLLEMRPERAAEGVEAGGHDVRAARGVRRGPREGLLHLGEQERAASGAPRRRCARRGAGRARLA